MRTQTNKPLLPPSPPPKTHNTHSHTRREEKEKEYKGKKNIYITKQVSWSGDFVVC
jgi:hypothetical protein